MRGRGVKEELTISTFKGRETKEDRYAWREFKAWLDRGKWKYRRFRYAKDITSIEIERLTLTQEQKTRFKQILSKINFDHDGIMSRGPETWFFDLKYKAKSTFKTWVNEDDYNAYYELSKESGIPFIIVAYVHKNEDGTLHDKLYFHRVRDPKAEPKPRKLWDDKPVEKGGKKWVYEMPESEYYLIIGFDVPWEAPRSLVDYYVLCRKIEELYMAWKENRAPKFSRDYALEVIEEIKRVYPKIWQIGVPIMDYEGDELRLAGLTWKAIPWKRLWRILSKKCKGSPHE